MYAKPLSFLEAVFAILLLNQKLKKTFFFSNNADSKPEVFA